MLVSECRHAAVFLFVPSLIIPPPSLLPSASLSPTLSLSLSLVPAWHPSAVRPSGSQWGVTRRNEMSARPVRRGRVVTNFTLSPSGRCPRGPYIYDIHNPPSVAKSTALFILLFYMFCCVFHKELRGHA